MGVSRVKWGSCFRPESSYWMAGSSKLHQNSVFVQNLVTCFVFQTAFQSDLLVQSYCPGAIQPQCFSSFIPLHLEPCSSRTEDWIPLNLWSNWGQPYMKDFLSPSDFLGSKMIPKMMIFFSKTTSLSQKWWFFLHTKIPRQCCHLAQVVRDISRNFWSKSSSTRSARVVPQQDIQGPNIGTLDSSRKVFKVDAAMLKY